MHLGKSGPQQCSPKFFAAKTQNEVGRGGAREAGKEVPEDGCVGGGGSGFQTETPGAALASPILFPRPLVLPLLGDEAALLVVKAVPSGVGLWG